LNIPLLRFIRRVSNASQYGDYIQYVQEVGETCGFTLLKDRLRIASTKRICFLATNRNYTRDNWSRKLTEIDEFIKSRSAVYSKGIDSNQVNVSSKDLNSFVTRPKDQVGYISSLL